MAWRLWTFHVSAILRNLTTNEIYNASRYAYLKDRQGRFFNPFDGGIAENFWAFWRYVGEPACRRPARCGMALPEPQACWCTDAAPVVLEWVLL